MDFQVLALTIYLFIFILYYHLYLQIYDDYIIHLVIIINITKSNLKYNNLTLLAMLLIQEFEA